MSQLQNQILNLYQQAYPNQTLREMSHVSQINISRVFRLLNGYEMKVSEYERIQSAISKKKIKNKDLYSITKRCQENLSPKKINYIIEEMEMYLSCEFKKESINQITEGA